MTSRSTRLDSCWGAAVAAMIGLVSLAPSLAAGETPISPCPGLELVPSKNVSTLYRRPDVDTSVYGKIIVGEPAIEFRKNWNPRDYGTYGLSVIQLKKIRVDLAAMAKSVFTKTLSDGGYEIVTETRVGRGARQMIRSAPRFPRT